jgi:hypothetical protein
MKNLTNSQRNQITSEIEALEIRFKSIPCDNNGNPTDWKLYHTLLSNIERREELLKGRIIENVGIER